MERWYPAWKLHRGSHSNTECSGWSNSSSWRHRRSPVCEPLLSTTLAAVPCRGHPPSWCSGRRLSGLHWLYPLRYASLFGPVPQLWLLRPWCTTRSHPVWCKTHTDRHGVADLTVNIHWARSELDVSNKMDIKHIFKLYNFDSIDIKGPKLVWPDIKKATGNSRLTNM